jgi:3-isopropylmalate/(R)-2-methylmalate dehydratase small subunit
LADGSQNPDFVLNKPQYEGAGVLIAGENFGCGSSREHAPWALLDQGITCVIAPSFADIFYNNCGKNGILAIALPIEVCEALAAQAGGSNSVFEVDLATKTVAGPDGEVISFDYDEGRREKLLKGLDDIALSLMAEGDISTFERGRKLSTPWLERV